MGSMRVWVEMGLGDYFKGVATSIRNWEEKEWARLRMRLKQETMHQLYYSSLWLVHDYNALFIYFHASFPLAITCFIPFGLCQSNLLDMCLNEFPHVNGLYMQCLTPKSL